MELVTDFCHSERSRVVKGLRIMMYVYKEPKFQWPNIVEDYKSADDLLGL